MSSKTIEINGRKIGNDYPPYIIAELSANHNGSLDRALETIRAAHECGADAIKIQTYTADTMTIDCDREEFVIKRGLWSGYNLYDLYKWAETPYEWHRSMFDYANSLGITIFSTPFDETAVDLLESLGTPAYKIASFEAVDLPLIRYVASKGKPMIMSTGMCSEEEITESVAVARDSGCEELILLHCISSYPTPVNQANLLQMPFMAERLGTICGLSDHTLGTTVAVAAAALGACVIEKHFTLNRSDDCPDCAFSIEPTELNQLCQQTSDVWSALGVPSFERQEAEKDNIQFRRSLYFIKAMKAGEIISSSHIRRIRPGYGLHTKHFDQLIGKRVIKDIAIGTAVDWDLIDD